MTYRGVYRDGIVVMQGEVGLRNGAAVEVTPARDGRVRKGAAKTARRSGSKPKKSAGSAKPLPAFGIWKDRWPNSMSSAEVACRMREQVSRRTR